MAIAFWSGEAVGKSKVPLCSLSFGEDCYIIVILHRNIPFTTDYGCPVRKMPSLHCRKSTTTPKLLGMAEAYFVCYIGPNFSDFFDLCLHWVSVVGAFYFESKAILSFLKVIKSQKLFFLASISQKEKKNFPDFCHKSLKWVRYR